MHNIIEGGWSLLLSLSFYFFSFLRLFFSLTLSVFLLMHQLYGAGAPPQTRSIVLFVDQETNPPTCSCIWPFDVILSTKAMVVKGARIGVLLYYFINS